MTLRLGCSYPNRDGLAGWQRGRSRGRVMSLVSNICGVAVMPIRLPRGDTGVPSSGKKLCWKYKAMSVCQYRGGTESKRRRP